MDTAYKAVRIPTMQVASPVALFIFNRPDLTRSVFQRIAAAKPRVLLVIADGPRSVPEWALCEATRAVIESVDWPCDVRTNFSDTNLGCRRRVSSGIDWVFEQVDRAIILEDDCVPHPTFFRYCDELLERYEDDERVMSISGDNFQAGKSRTSDSYYFSVIAHVWGWATWRRAWRKYDVTMRDWPEARESTLLHDLLGSEAIATALRRALERVYSGEVDTWDSQWSFATWMHRGLTALPDVNLISNIGFGDGATHTRSRNSEVANLPVSEMQFPLRHPKNVIANRAADAFTLRQLAETNSA